MGFKVGFLIRRIIITVCVSIFSVFSFKFFEYLYDTEKLKCKGSVIISTLQSGDSTISIPFFTEAPGLHIFRFKFDKIFCETPSIFIPFIDGNYIAVYLNGHLIGTSGSPVASRSLRWNKPELFLIERDFLKDTNEIVLTVKTEVTVGISSPILISDLNHVKLRYLLLAFLNGVLNQFYIMVFVVVGIFMILLPFLIGLRKHRAVIGLSLILLAFYLIDYLYVPYLLVPYPVFKKIALSCLYLSLALYAFGFVYEFDFKGFLKHAVYVVLFASLLLSAILLMMENNSVVVRRTYLKMDVIVFVSVALILQIFFKRTLVSDSKKITTLTNLNFAAIMFLVPYIFRDVYVLIKNLSVPLLTQYVLPVFVLVNISFIMNDFVTLYRRLVLEKRRVEFLEMESMRDPLTGALNRRFLSKIREIVPELYSVCLVDIDGFKEFNDKFGHLLGDCVLKSVALQLSSALRKDDHVVRYGGDEFLILLYKVSALDAEQIMRKIREKFVNEKIRCEDQEFLISFSYGIASIGEGEDLFDMVKIADLRLYEAKNSKIRT
uniref:GGDEF domain-containing protein n=1 Tax=candidate division WOR-3 bacterium TaxID=2052148 RepID=A0A7V4E4M7_UNCW3